MDLLTGKVALITGSSRGIGAAIARLFAREGASVAVHGRDAAALSQVRTDIEHHGGRAIQVPGDVTRFNEIEIIRQQTENTLGPIDILVANAGGSFSPPGPLEETSEAGWRASIDGNLTATFLTIKSILPGMKQRKTGKHHHDLFGGGSPATSSCTNPLLGSEGGYSNAFTGCCCAGRTLRNPGELHRA